MIEIYIYRYICENSFDAYSWQILESKQIFISKLLNNQLDTRMAKDLDDSVLDYAEVKALAVGDPLIEKRVNAQNRLSRLMLINSASIARKEKIRQTLDNIDRNKAMWEKEIDDCKKDIAIAQAKENKDIDISDEDRKAMRDDIYQALFFSCSNVEQTVMKYRGFDIIVSPKQYDEENIFVYIQGNHKYYLKLGTSSLGYMTRINNFINNLPNHLKELEARYKENMHYYKTGKKELEKKDEYQTEIAMLKKSIEEMDKQLQKEKMVDATKTKTK